MKRANCFVQIYLALSDMFIQIPVSMTKQSIQVPYLLTKMSMLNNVNEIRVAIISIQLISLLEKIDLIFTT